MKTNQSKHTSYYMLLLGVLILIPKLLMAQSFDCTSNLYQVVNGKDLKVLIPSTGQYQTVGSSSVSYNGAGFNAEDGYIYGIASGNTLVQVNNTGQATAMGAISGFSALSYSGDFDLDGNWYSFKKGNQGWTMNKLDIDSSPLAIEATNLTEIPSPFSNSSNTADIAYNAISNRFYGMTSGKLIAYDHTNGTVEVLADYSDQAESGPYGAVWSDETGKTYFFNNNTGNIYRASFDASGDILSFAFLAVSEPNGSNDGMGCALAQAPVFPEICDNGLDDDGDGLTDCEDPDCTASESCGISTKVVSSTFVCDQSIATYHTFYTNHSSLTNTITVTETLPTGFVFLQDTLEFDAGGFSDFNSQPVSGDEGVISWGEITIEGGETVRISYDVTLNESANTGMQSNHITVATGTVGTLVSPEINASNIEVDNCPVETSFSCEPAFYQVYKKKGKEQPSMYGKLNPITGNYDPIAVASDFANGLGFDINTGLVYGTSGNRFIRLDAEGIVLDMGITFDKKVYRGDLNDHSEWYGVVGSNMVVIDVSGTPELTHTYSDQGLSGWDIAYNIDGNFYALHNQTLQQFNTTTNTKNTVGTITGNGIPSSGGYGAQWTGADGKLYGSHNQTGNIIQVDVNTLEARVVSLSTDGLSKNDGFSCPNEIPVVFEFDYGDNTRLPQSRILSYRLDLKQDDIPDLSTFWLGSTVNGDMTDPSNIDANGDLDDGFTLTTEIDNGTLTALFALNSNINGTAYHLAGFDWNDDGAFDEIKNYSIPLEGANTTMETIALPQGFDEGMINVRVIVSESPLSESNISGDIMKLGEVEDYRYMIQQPCTDCQTPTGTNGGLESNGSLANAIAKRNYSRVKNNDKSHLKAFQPELRSYKMARQNSENDLSSYFPEVGATGNETVSVSSPDDLITITNATNVFAADYYIEDTRVAGSLLLTTEDDVYNHSKNVCDRLNGKSVENVQLMTVNGISIILAKIVQESNGIAEYSAWFSARDHHDRYEIFSQWNVDNYPEGEYLNFQVWSSSPQQVLHMANHMLDELNTQKTVIKSDISSELPRVLVKKGQYQNGQLTLTLINNSNATTVTVETNARTTEYSDFVNERYNVTLNGNVEQEVVIETGYIFDAGVSLSIEGSEQYDALYLADGAWGTDYDQAITLVDRFTTLEVVAPSDDESYLVERGFEIEGSSNDVVNIFRNLKAGENSLSLAPYNTISFDIMNSHELEIVLVEKGLVAWEDRLKTTVSANKEMTHVVLAISDFVGMQNTSDLDIQSVVFSYINQSGIVENFEFAVDQLTFGNGSTVMNSDSEMSGVSFEMYPNPANDFITILSNFSDAQISIFDINGRMLQSQSMTGLQKENQLPVNLNRGIYYVRMVSGGERYTKKLIIR